MSLASKGISAIAELMPSVRVILGMIQIMSGMRFAFSVKFPTVFGFLIDQLKIFSLDFMGAFRLGCANDVWDFYDHFFASILIAPIFCGVALALYLLRPINPFVRVRNKTEQLTMGLLVGLADRQVPLPARTYQDTLVRRCENGCKGRA